MPLPKPDPGHGNRTNESPLLRRDAPRRVQLELVFAPPAPEKKPGRDRSLEARARERLIQQGAAALAAKVRVEWSGRLRSAAGRAEFAQARVLLNRRLAAHGEAEIDRTLRHELAHLLASARAGRRRLAPHGPEWRRACADLGIADELRCHNLPFPIRRLKRRYLYTCPHCRREVPRIRPLRRSSACLACCRAHHRGRYDERFKLRLVKR
jgi:predicted SprT family Zn-dependent metalloprotease